MFKIRLASGKFYIEGKKDRRVAYFKTSADARNFVKNHHLKGAKIVQVSTGKHIANKPHKGGKGRGKGRRGGKGRGKGRRGGHRKVTPAMEDIYRMGFF